jgi:hypothetical protein
VPADSDGVKTTVAPQTTPEPSESKDPTPLEIFGIVAGGTVLLTAVAYLAYLAYLRENKRRTQYSPTPEQQAHITGGGTYYAPLTYAYPTYSV